MSEVYFSVITNREKGGNKVVCQTDSSNLKLFALSLQL